MLTVDTIFKNQNLCQTLNGRNFRTVSAKELIPHGKLVFSVRLTSASIFKKSKNGTSYFSKILGDLTWNDTFTIIPFFSFFLWVGIVGLGSLD